MRLDGGSLVWLAVALVMMVVVLVGHVRWGRHGLRAVLEMRQRPDLRMCLQPAIDEQLDDLRPA